jgi:hypothetical protein
MGKVKSQSLQAGKYSKKYNNNPELLWWYLKTYYIK